MMQGYGGRLSWKDYSGGATMERLLHGIRPQSEFRGILKRFRLKYGNEKFRHTP
jgi:hypothetical protein